MKFLETLDWTRSGHFLDNTIQNNIGQIDLEKRYPAIFLRESFQIVIYFLAKVESNSGCFLSGNTRLWADYPNLMWSESRAKNLFFISYCWLNFYFMFSSSSLKHSDFLGLSGSAPFSDLESIFSVDPGNIIFCGLLYDPPIFRIWNDFLLPGAIDIFTRSMTNFHGLNPECHRITHKPKPLRIMALMTWLSELDWIFWNRFFGTPQNMAPVNPFFTGWSSCQARPCHRSQLDSVMGKTSPRSLRKGCTVLWNRLQICYNVWDSCHSSTSWIVR